MYSGDNILSYCLFHPFVNCYLEQMDKAAGVYAAGEMGYTLDCPICKARDINLAAVYQKPRYKRTTRLHVLG